MIDKPARNVQQWHDFYSFPSNFISEMEEEEGKDEILEEDVVVGTSEEDKFSQVSSRDSTTF